MGGMKVKDGLRPDSGPLSWKLAVKPSDNRALSALLRIVRAERQGTNVSAADVIRESVHDALARRADDGTTDGEQV